RASPHATVEQTVQRLAHLARLDPVVRRSGVVLVLAANERAVLHARDIAGMRAREVRVGPQLVVQANERTRLLQLGAQPVVFGLRAVTPVDALGLGKTRDLRDPLPKRAVAHPRGSIRLVGCGGGCTHCARLLKGKRPSAKPGRSKAGPIVAPRSQREMEQGCSANG